MTIQLEHTVHKSPEGPIFLPEIKEEDLVRLFLAFDGDPASLLSDMTENATNPTFLYEHLKFCLLQSRGGVEKISDDASEEEVYFELQRRMELYDAINAAQNKIDRRSALADVAINRML